MSLTKRLPQKEASIHCNSALVQVKGGRVCEQGTHNELMAAGGDYCKLVRRQLEPEGKGIGKRNGSVVSLGGEEPQ
jgi:ABC-type transport system involved in cytochrome bd biosynthesis fused ATPase/permease subunit